MDDTTLATAEHENMLAAFAMVAARSQDGFVAREGGVAAIVSRAPLPLFNQVAIEGSGATPPALEAAIGRVAAAGVPFVVSLRAGVDDAFTAVVEALGLRESGSGLPGMAAHPIASAAAPPLGLEVSRVREPSGIEEHLRINAIASEVPPELLAFLATVGLEDDPEAVVLLGAVDGRAVTTAMGYRTGRTIGVYSVATLAEARRRGYGAAMTREVMRAGAGLGCDIAILQSSEMGLHVYESLGFRTVVRYRSFQAPTVDPGGG